MTGSLVLFLIKRECFQYVPVKYDSCMLDNFIKLGKLH